MPELVTAIEEYAGWLYLLLGALFAREVVATARALRARGHARFGVELEAANGRVVRGLVSMLLITIVAFGTYLVATVVAPGLPADLRRRLGDEPLTVPTLVAPLPTATATRPAFTATPPPARIVTRTPAASGRPGSGATAPAGASP